MSIYEAVIGLEVHVQLKTKSKIFCGCPANFGADPNTQICPVCCGYPGVLPVVNRAVVEGLVRSALALDCRINKHSVFARKQYFYPDLPKNYQISQYELPLAENGHLQVKVDEQSRDIRIHRIHLEEDAGKLLHAIGSRPLDYSLVDLNRTGVPLMEIVSEPDLRTPEEAAAYLSHLRAVLRYVGVSDCDMEKGSMRCDANVSIRPSGAQGLGTKTEVKNMNSFRSVREAIAYEIDRQTLVLDSGGRIVQETRLWDAQNNVTQSMRSKEEAHDYRYFPDPDLVPLNLSDQYLEELQKSLPELPEARSARYVEKFGLSSYDASVLTAEKKLADFYEEGLKGFEGKMQKEAAKPLANWLTTELLGRLHAAKKEIEESLVSPESLAALVALVYKGAVSGKSAKVVFDEMFVNGGEPAAIVNQKGLGQIDDEKQISEWVDEIILVNDKAVQDIKSGKTSAMGALVGGVMRKSKGRANPQIVNRILHKKFSQ